MAKQTNGTLGGFVGKLGPVVGYRWKNVWCVRSQSRNVNNPRTEAQQEHRSLFKQEVQLAGRMRWAVNIGQDEGGRCAQNPSKIFFKIFLFSAIGVFFLAMSEKSRIFAI